MINTKLIDVVNSGHAWAFMGNGLSVDAGCPSWEKLIDNLIENLAENPQTDILTSRKYSKAREVKDYPRCLSVIESKIGRDALERMVRHEIEKFGSPSKLGLKLAEWPFRAIISTNYDNLIEKALSEINQLGWASVGNSEDEIRKLSRGIANVVWHIHGAIDLDKDKSKLILSEEDYDFIYLNETRIKEQLKAVLSQQRIIFIGFSFQDAEVKRILKFVGNLCSPDRPAYAFLGDISGSEHAEERNELLLNYNIEVITYNIVDGSHRQLHEILDVYESMILGRSLRFGQPYREAPSYDEQSTGLLIYNQLCLNERDFFPEKISNSLLRARILSLLKHKGDRKVLDIIDELNERIRIIQGVRKSVAEVNNQIAVVLKDLISMNLAEYDEQTSSVSLTRVGYEFVSNQAAISETLKDQFASSLNARAGKLYPGDPVVSKKIANVAISFINDCIEKRSLGVALVLGSNSTIQQEYQMVALLRNLPEFIVKLSSHEEAMELIHLIQEILSSTNDIERNYIGMSLQAQFGIHILGYDPKALETRARQLENTLFLIDSSTLIPFLARSSTGHSSARKLIQLLKIKNATLVSTKLLAAEVSEHACWALNNVDKSPGSIKLFTISSGHAGARPNAFLEGFLEEIRQSLITQNISEFVHEVCGSKIKLDVCTDEDVISILKKDHINCLAFDEWSGFDSEFWALRDENTEQIKDLRVKAGNYKHYRQVKAEAEALIIVQKFREKKFNYENKALNDAYFVSNTRIINQLDESGYSATMSADSVLQWLSTITHCDVAELGFLFDGLLWEMHEKGFSIISESKLRSAFAPLIHASKNKLLEFIEQNKVLLAELYGEAAEKAFKEADEVEIPIILESINIRKANLLEKELINEKERSRKAQATASISEKEKQELSILRDKEKRRIAKGKSKQRAAESRQGKGKKRKKKK